MKLITEASFNVSSSREDTSEGKRMYIEGIFAQAEVVNGNKRFYPKSVLKESIDKYINEFVSRNRALGEINHPEYPMPNPDNAAIRIVEMKWDGNNVLGKALILKTDKGRKLQDLIEDGYQGGVSTRALGELRESKVKKGVNEVMPGLMTTAVDYVSDPSGPDCWVKGINESLSEWAMDEKGQWIRKAIEETKNMAFEDLDPKKREAMIVDTLKQFFNQM
jgi:hypothetical protein